MGAAFETVEELRLAVNRKRGKGLQWVATVAVVAAYLAASLVLSLALDSLFGLLARRRRSTWLSFSYGCSPWHGAV